MKPSPPNSAWLNLKSTEFQWNPKGSPLGFHWISVKFAHVTQGTLCNIWGNPLNFNEILRGTYPLGSLNFNEIRTIYKGYPFAKCKKSIEFQWNPKGYSLGVHWISMKFIHFTRGSPCKMWGNLLIFNEILRRTPQDFIEFPWISHILQGYLLQNVKKSIECQWNPTGYPLGVHWISLKFAHFTRGTPSPIRGNQLNFNKILRGSLRIALIFVNFVHFTRGAIPLAKWEEINSISMKSWGVLLRSSLKLNGIHTSYKGYSLANM